jgi:hypothetical protein
MKTEIKQCIITHISTEFSITTTAKPTRKQLLKIMEPAYQHPTDPARNGLNNNYEVELWNGVIDKHSLVENFKIGDKVDVQLWVNGQMINTRDGQKYETKLALHTIRKAS